MTMTMIYILSVQKETKNNVDDELTLKKLILSRTATVKTVLYNEV